MRNLGTPVDSDGNDLEKGVDPPPLEPRDPEDYSPFDSRAEFELASFLYVEEEMSGPKIDQLVHILASLYPDNPPPISDHRELYSVIDSIQSGEVAWNSFSVSYNGELPGEGLPIPPWMTDKYEVWFRDPLILMENQIGCPDYKGKIDYSPKRVFRNGKRRYRDLMSGNWAWEQAVCFSMS